MRIHETIVGAGRLYRKELFLSDIRAARKSLEAAIAEGLFVAEEELEFDYVEHYDSRDAWTAGLAKPRVAELVADEKLIEEACALMPDGEGEILVTQRERAARFGSLVPGA